MFSDKFSDFLVLSAQLRQEYPTSLGRESSNWLKILSTFDTNVPEFYNVIYSNVSGTLRSIKDQSLMDFIPGYIYVAKKTYHLHKQ